MASQPLVMSDPRMVAEFVRQSEFKGLTEKRFAVPPDYAALLFVNGELKDAFKGGHFSVGGVMTSLKSIIGGSSHVGMLLADLKPFQVKFAVQGTSRDQISIAGVATFELQVNPDKPSNILGMMHGVNRAAADKLGPGRRALSRDDILVRMQPHLTDRVVEAGLSRMDAADIRGNVGFQNKLQADFMEEVERIFGSLGLLINSVSLEWAANEAEAEAFARAEAERAEDRADFELANLRRQIERQDDAFEFQIKSELEKAKLQSATEDELERLALESQVALIDTREAHERRQELELIEHEVLTLRKERTARFENEIAETDHRETLLRKMAKHKEFERQAAELDAQQVSRMRKDEAFTQQDIDQRVQQQQFDNIERMQAAERVQIEFEARMRILEADAEGKRRTDEKALDAKSKIDMINALKGQSAEVIMAINAGLSPEVANVLVEQARAKAEGDSGAKVMSVMQQMVDAATNSQIRSEEQARAMFKMGMDGAANVAQGNGASGGGSGTGTQSSASADAQIECPKCSRMISSTARFCIGCGMQLRT
ncbi:MAG: hypothetical protein AAGI03_01345 [Pseudomonadota bacterium]